MNLGEEMSREIERMVARIAKFSLKNVKEAVYIAQFGICARSAAKKRERFAENGETVPPFLIASITKKCNLFCKGCYARELNQSTACEPEFSDSEWDTVFSQAEQLGISFILLAGGEPLMRPDVIGMAARHKKIIFPIFTNGTMLDERYLALLDQKRNLLPVFSVEGERMQTDHRRGAHAFQTVMEKMDMLQQKSIPFGASVTVTTENQKIVTDDAYISNLYQKGCAIVFFVEYVPVTQETAYLTLSEDAVGQLTQRCEELRGMFSDMILLSFPGDEQLMGAAWRREEDFSTSAQPAGQSRARFPLTPI